MGLIVILYEIYDITNFSCFSLSSKCILRGNLTTGTALTVGSNACDNPHHVYHNSCLSAEESV